MKITKRITSALLALVMALSLINGAMITAFAEEGVDNAQQTAVEETADKADVVPADGDAAQEGVSGEQAENASAPAMLEGESTKVPVLISGVTDRTVTIQTGMSYQLDDLMDGKIFTDPNSGKLTYENYFYQKSADNGATWSDMTGFKQMEFGGVDKSLTNSVAGTYIYKFFAKNAAGLSTDTWTLTLIVKDMVTENINFYVGQDQNYKTNGNVYPVLELYKTAGIDDNQFDYVGWFINSKGSTEYVYNPADYTIIDGETDYVVIDGVQYELHDYEKVAFTNSAFDNTAADATASNTVVKNYNMFYASLETGRYSTRGYGWNTETNAYDIYLGGQSMPLPMEKDIYGGGGNDIYLGIVSCYVSSTKADNTYFTADECRFEMIMPVTGSMIHAGMPYSYTSYGRTYAAYPFLSFEAGNGSLYNIYAYPTDTEHYMFNQVINQTTKATYYVTTKNVNIASAVHLYATVPADAEFDLYFQYNNFNTKRVEPLNTMANGDTKLVVYRISSGNSNYTWRLSDPNGKYVTKAGWLANSKTDIAKTFAFGADAATDKKLHDFSKLGTVVVNRDEADIQVFLDHSGFKSVSGSYRVRAFRMWEIINSDTANIMVEPDFNVQVLQGNKADVKQVNGGNAVGNWIDVTPTGTDIVAVNYEAIDMYSDKDVAGTHAGLFPATAPERTGVFVMTNEAAGSADATVCFNGGTTTSRGAEWDYNYDTWYYLDTDKAPSMDFTVTGSGSVDVSYAVVTTDAALKSTLSDWTAVTADANGVYHADMLKFRSAKTAGGTVIIKMTDATGTSYRLVRVAEMSVTAKNVSNSGEPIMPGDKVELSFRGMYRGLDKVSGIFNPTTYYIRYSAGENEFSGTLSQYKKMDQVSITLTVPEDITFQEGKNTATYSFSNGYYYGSMYAASSPFDTLYKMTDTGVGTNFSAVGVSFVLSRLADVPVEVAKKVYYNVNLNITDNSGKVNGSTVEVKDSAGNVIAPEADGTYKLGYGTYTYSVVKNGYVCLNESFTLGSANASSVRNGVLSMSVKLSKVADGAWDGSAASEPAKDGDGIYQISNGAELAWFAQHVNSGNGSSSAVLTKDIDLAGYDWTPIGMNSGSKQFAGSFDGQNHKISNLFVNYAGTTAVTPYQGLFGVVNGANTKHAVIRNLTVQGAVALTSTKSVSTASSGGVIGRADYLDITNVHADVDVTVNRIGGNWDNIGGLIGEVYYDTNITNCSNSGTIKGWRNVAGIIGKLNMGTITNCSNNGAVDCLSTNAAGIAANVGSTCRINGCYNTGAVNAAGNYAAGIVGYCINSEISNCFNVGKITCSAEIYGSVIGTLTNANALTKNLYYLDSTCDKGGIGSVKNAETQTATAVTAADMKTAAFIDKMNADLTEAAFKKGGDYPILTWQTYVPSSSGTGSGSGSGSSGTTTAQSPRTGDAGIAIYCLTAIAGCIGSGAMLCKRKSDAE